MINKATGVKGNKTDFGLGRRGVKVREYLHRCFSEQGWAVTPREHDSHQSRLAASAGERPAEEEGRLEEPGDLQGL